MNNCTYFSSDEWDQRLSETEDRVYNFKTSIWCTDEVSDSEQILDEVVEKTDWGREELSEVNLSKVIEEINIDKLKYGNEIENIDDSQLKIPDACPHEAVEGTNRCQFHMPDEERRNHNIGEEELTEAFLNKIKNGDKDEKVFTGASFPSLDLKGQKLSSDDNFPIHIEACEIDGKLNLKRASIDQPFFCTGSIINEISVKDGKFINDAEFTGSVFNDSSDFTYTTFVGDAEFWNATFEKDVSFYASRFEEYAEFRDANFCDNTLFKYSHIDRDIEFWDADFSGEVVCNSMVVDNAAEFRYATFEQPVKMNGMNISDNIEFRHAEFEEDVSFRNISVAGDAHYWSTRFNGKVEFWACDFQGYFECNNGGKEDRENNASFHDDAIFRYTVFGKDAEFYCVVFEGNADFRETTFNGTTEFNNAVFHGTADFTGATHTNVDFSNVLSMNSLVKLVDNELPAGRITQPTEGETYYDVSQSTIGNLDLASPDNDPVFGYFKFYRTKFSGFDFADHRGELIENWRIHEVGVEKIEEENYNELETTYLNAKNGASGMGDTHAAAEFFLRERKYQRKSYFKEFLEGDGIANRAKFLYKWTASWMYNLTCGYGERPFRTIGFGFLIIIAFTGIYNYTVNLPGEETPLRLLTFSIQTFVSLLLGGIQPENQTVLVQFLIAFQAFIGGFAIALFVFALTRSVQR